MKIALALVAALGLFCAGMAAEEKLEWRTCRALSFFDQPASPALAQFKVRRPAEAAHHAAVRNVTLPVAEHFAPIATAAR